MMPESAMPLVEPVAGSVNLLPERVRERLYVRSGWGEAVAPERLGKVSAEEVSQWDAAKTIVGCAKRPRREVFVGYSAREINLQHTPAPGLTERSFARMVDRQHLDDQPALPSPGAAFEPMPGTGVSGGWEGRKKTGMRRAATAGLAATAAFAPLVWAWMRARRSSP